MAAPETANIKNLTGTWTMNRTESDQTDPILQLQGIGWILRKAIGMMTVTLVIKQYIDEDGTEHIDIEQPGAAGIKGTEEKRSIPKDGSKGWRDHEDHVFGLVKGYSQWIKPTDLSDADEHEKYLKAGFESADQLLDSFVESQGNGWTARQIWGFEVVNGVRKYVRHVVVQKGNDFKHARLVYDFKSE